MHWTFVLVGYGIVLASIGLYAWWTLSRGRKLSADIPAERRRFLD